MENNLRVKADINEYEKQKEERPDFKKLVLTKGEYLSEKYKNLLAEAFPRYKNKTLEDLIKQSKAELGDDNVYFSIDKNGLIVGFMAVVADEDENKVNNVKICSLKDDDDNKDIMPDFLDELLKKYDSVSWMASDSNKANFAYKLYAKHHDGFFKDVNDFHKIFYYVPGVKS